MRTSLGWSRGRLQFKKGRMMRTSSCWIRMFHGLLQVATHPQLGCHVQLVFSRHPSQFRQYLPHTTLKRGVLGSVRKGTTTCRFGFGPRSRTSWIMLCDHKKVLHHLFWANIGFVSSWALSPSCGCPTPGRPQA